MTSASDQDEIRWTYLPTHLRDARSNGLSLNPAMDDDDDDVEEDDEGMYVGM
jgi:hypothetical protein